jgi:hypothetical protein
MSLLLCVIEFVCPNVRFMDRAGSDKTYWHLVEIVDVIESWVQEWREIERIIRADLRQIGEWP